MLLILTSEKDLAADYLIVRLMELGLPYTRFNNEHEAKYGLEYKLTPEISRRIVVGEQQVDLSNIESVWYRRAILPRASSSLPREQQRFAEGEVIHFWTGLLLDGEARWVNPIDKVYIAEHKLYQLRVALSVGLKVPRTLVSRDNVALSAFLQDVDNAICKPIFHGLYFDGTDRFSVYTRRVTPADFEDSESIRQCPVLLQAVVQRQADVRVTFIGHSCFCVHIRSSDPEMIDWRVPSTELRYSVADIPPILEDLCRQVMSILGLVYAAFDFILTPEGDYVFLEVNPTGEWAWLENRLGIRMRDAFVDLFFGPKK